MAGRPIISSLSHCEVVQKAEQVLVAKPFLGLQGFHDFFELLVLEDELLHQDEVVGLLVLEDSLIGVFDLSVDCVAVQEVGWTQHFWSR